jgi:hypothetical protein
VNGTSTSLWRVAKANGICPKVLHSRVIENGWTLERALAEPTKDISGFAKQHAAEHRCWQAMKRPCTNPRQDGFEYYGGQGVSVCDRWSRSFRAFYDDMGPRPSAGHSLDRFPDKEGNYEPGNVRWATFGEQQKNRKSNRPITWRGRTMLLTDWATELGIKSGTLGRRLDAGWPVEKAMTAPVRKWQSQVEGRLGQ